MSVLRVGDPASGLAGRPIGGEARAVALAPAPLGRLVEDREGARHERQVEALGASLGQHGAQILADRVDVEGWRAGSWPASALAILGPRTLRTFGPPEVSAKRSIIQAVSLPRCFVKA